MSKDTEKYVPMAGYKLHTKDAEHRGKMLGKLLVQRTHGGHGLRGSVYKGLDSIATSSANPIYRQASPHSTCVLPSIGMSLRRTREGEGEYKKKMTSLIWLSYSYFMRLSKPFSGGDSTG